MRVSYHELHNEVTDIEESGIRSEKDPHQNPEQRQQRNSHKRLNSNVQGEASSLDR